MQSQNKSATDAVTEPGSHEQRGAPVIETPADVYKHYYAPQQPPAAAVRTHKSILKSAPISTDSKPLSSAAAASEQLTAAGGERLTAAGQAADETAPRIHTQTVSVAVLHSHVSEIC